MFGIICLSLLALVIFVVYVHVPNIKIKKVAREITNILAKYNSDTIIDVPSDQSKSLRKELYDSVTILAANNISKDLRYGYNKRLRIEEAIKVINELIREIDHHSKMLLNYGYKSKTAKPDQLYVGEFVANIRKPLNIQS